MKYSVMNMPKHSLNRFVRTIAALCLAFAITVWILPSSVMAQFGVRAGNSLLAKSSEPVTFEATWTIDEGGAQLMVTAKLNPSWHIYSVTQPKNGPRPTTLSIAGPSSVRLTSQFKADREPVISESDLFPVPVEEYEHEITWTASLETPVDFRGDIQLDVSCLVCRSLLENGGCQPMDLTLTATFSEAKAASQAKASSGVAMSKDQASVKQALSKQLGGNIDVLALLGEAGQSAGRQIAPSKNLADGLFGPHIGSSKPLTMVAEPVAKTDLKDAYREEDYVVAWVAAVEPQSVSPGGRATLTFTAFPDRTYHVYEAKVDDGEFATNFVLTNKSGLKIGIPQPDQPVVRKQELPSLPPIGKHQGKVTWSLPIEVPVDASPGLKQITGMIGYQACTATSCQMPKGLQFRAQLRVGDTGEAVQAVSFKKATHADALDTAAEVSWVDSVELDVQAPAESIPANDDVSSNKAVPAKELDSLANDDEPIDQEKSKQSGTSFPLILLSAFIGGFILNFMPCVLPVIGLKVMSFVTQAGEDRRRVLHLNLAYAAGICFVFALLAVLAIFFRFGWGEQFQYFSVRLAATIGLFAFALSYFDVWEIPIPGFASGGASQGLQNKEGLSGAFNKGIFTTLLATPCSGPFLGTVFGATLTLPPLASAVVFTFLALGMSFPYLLLGLRPELISYLPKPGPWMETFKQLMAFFFLAAVCYFFYQFADSDKLSVFVTLIGVWFGLWIIGKVPSWEPIRKRAIAWTSGVAAATAIGIFAFTSLKSAPELEWVDYNEQRLASYQSQGKTVLVDFSAKWCATCLLNLDVAIDTNETKKVVNELGVIPMYADWTDYDPAITAKLKELDSKSIPLLAIYPAGRPNAPIILRDIVTQQGVIDALRQAGPSKSSNAQRQLSSSRTAVASR